MASRSILCRPRRRNTTNRLLTASRFTLSRRSCRHNRHRLRTPDTLAHGRVRLTADRRCDASILQAERSTPEHREHATAATPTNRCLVDLQVDPQEWVDLQE